MFEFEKVVLKLHYQFFFAKIQFRWFKDKGKLKTSCCWFNKLWNNAIASDNGSLFPAVIGGDTLPSSVFCSWSLSFEVTDGFRSEGFGILRNCCNW